MKFTSKVNRGIVYLFSLILILGILTACESAEEKDTSTGDSEDATFQMDESTLTLGTMPVGGTINTVGNALASLISSNSDLQVSVSPYAGLSVWGPQLNEGGVAIGLATEPELAWGYKGEKDFESMENMRFLVKGNAIVVPGFVVRKDSDINSVADLVGKRVTSEYPGSASVKALLDAALSMNGLTWDDVQGVPTPTTVDGMKGLQNDNVDAAYGLTANTAVSEEVHNAVGLKSFDLLDDYSPDQIDEIPQDIQDELSANLPGSQFTIMEPHGYIAEEQLGAKYFLATVVSAHLSDEAVYEMLETLWDHYEESFDIHPWMQQWVPENMFEPNPVVPYHSGAVEFYKDQGLWSDETEEIQQELLELH